jgi:prepilin-type N-terminal cleavage/methylation domain-containing protein
MDYLKGIIDLRRKGQKGFTLVELLVVIAIIGILATLVLLQLGSARAKARDTQRITAVNQVVSAVEQYYEDNGTYPADIADATLSKYFSNGKVPKDPTTAAAYNYCVSGVKYQIAAELEQKAAALNSDSDLVQADIGAGVCKPGTTEACTAAADDCVYDRGAK